MTNKTSLLILASLLLISTVSAHNGYKCTHDLEDHPEPEFIDVEERFPAPEDRMLAYNNMRMKGYYGQLDALTGTDAPYRTYVAHDLIPPILSYVSGALKVKYPMLAPIKFSSSVKTVCGVNTPAELLTGVNTDFYLVVTTEYDTGSSWVASTGVCYSASGSKRPYMAKTTLNRDKFKPALVDGNVLLHEKNIVCTMHELTHALGFSSGLYKYFLDANGKVRSGHITSTVLDGQTNFVLNMEPLTSRLRAFYGCSTLKGGYLEYKSSSTAGSHWERRQFPFEAMSSGLIYQMQYSQFTLALLEGSGWYEVDYSFADPYHFGQGQGCEFALGRCSTTTPVAPDFCTGSSRGCASPGRGGGSCSSDSKSNGCKFYKPNDNYDCENPSGVDYARLPKIETYGRGAGSKCFSGTLSSSSSSASTTTFCFRYACSGSGTDTKLTVSVGTTSIACTKKGTVSVTGYKGTINCPDPISYCATVGLPICPRNCMGQGTCVSGTCVCNTGFKGTDCALRA